MEADFIDFFWYCKQEGFLIAYGALNMVIEVSTDEEL